MSTATDLFIPDVWSKATLQVARTYPTMINSPAIRHDPEMMVRASSEGAIGLMPFIRSMVGTRSEMQVRQAGPTKKTRSAGTLSYAKIQTVMAISEEELDIVISGTGDISLDNIPGQIAEARNYDQEQLMLSIIRGAMGSTGMASQTINDSANTITPDFITAAIAQTFGQKKSGEFVLWMDRRAIAALRIADPDNFKPASEDRLWLETYQGIPIYETPQDELIQGATYETYLIRKGSILYGAMPQSAKGVSSMMMKYDEHTLTNVLYDRNRLIIHPNGMSFNWKPNPANDTQCPSETELKDSTKWSLVAPDARMVGIVRVLSKAS